MRVYEAALKYSLALALSLVPALPIAWYIGMSTRTKAGFNWGNGFNFFVIVTAVLFVSFCICIREERKDKASDTNTETV